MSKRHGFKIDTESQNWLVSFSLAAGKPTVRARHLFNSQFLQAPDDSLQIAQIIPYEEWPAFAQSLIRHQEKPSQERLFK